MNYKFKVTARAIDFFKMSMKKTYRSPIGICNIVLFVAAVLMTVKFFGKADDIVRVLLLLLSLLIPVIQPVCIFFRSADLARMIPKDMTMETTDNGILVKVGELSELVGYNKIKNIIDTGDCLVISVGGRNGYFLFNRVLGDKKEDFIKFIKSKTV